MDALASLPPVVYGGLMVLLVVGLVYAWRTYQRCPHCGRLVVRVYRGWLRCGGCGRQYRRGLKFD